MADRNCVCAMYPDSKVHGANMGPTWVLSAQDGPHVDPMNLAVWDVTKYCVILQTRRTYAVGNNNYVLMVIQNKTNQTKWNHVPSNFWYKTHQISKLKCFSSPLEVVFSQAIEAMCWVKNEDVVGAAPTAMLQLHLSDQQFYCLPKYVLY